MRILLLALLALTSAAIIGLADAAETKVYRTVDENGNVIFTDVPPAKTDDPRKKTTVVEIKPANTFEPSGTQTDESGRQLWIVDDPSKGSATDLDELPTSYQSIAISMPAPDESIRSNNGQVSVAVNLSPDLDPQHRIQVHLDGQIRETGSSQSFILENVDRGTHTVHAVVVDQAGNSLLASAPTTFHVLRAHR